MYRKAYCPAIYLILLCLSLIVSLLMKIPLPLYGSGLLHSRMHAAK